jgi:electron transport complex protein RnfE
VTEAGAFSRHLWGRMPVLRAGIGLCPALAVSTSLKNAAGMGASVVFVLLCSSLAAPLLARSLGRRLAVLSYLAVAGALVTLAGSVVARYAPEVRAGLGIYLPLVAVNCLVLSGLEESGSRGFAPSFSRALATGLGFAFAVAVVSAVREAVGSGPLWGHSITGSANPPVAGAVLAPGAFITVGLLAGLATSLRNRKMAEAAKTVRS